MKTQAHPRSRLLWFGLPLFLGSLLVLGLGTRGAATPPSLALPFYQSADFTPTWFPAPGPGAGFHRIAPFAFQNQSGAQVTQEDLRGKIFVVNFFFTTCGGICPRMSAGMQQVQEAYAQDPDLGLISHSVTPERDTVEVLADYAQRIGATPGKWHLVTGEREKLYRLARGSYFADKDLGVGKGPEDFLHTENFLLIDGSLHIRGVYQGTSTRDVEQLIADIALLKAEERDPS